LVLLAEGCGWRAAGPRREPGTNGGGAVKTLGGPAGFPAGGRQNFTQLSGGFGAAVPRGFSGGGGTQRAGGSGGSFFRGKSLGLGRGLAFEKRQRGGQTVFSLFWAAVGPPGGGLGGPKCTPRGGGGGRKNSRHDVFFVLVLGYSGLAFGRFARCPGSWVVRCVFLVVATLPCDWGNKKRPGEKPKRGWGGRKGGKTD